MNPNRAEAFINLENAKHNYLEIRRMTSAAHIICVIKANAYGHGAVRLAQLYESLGADILAVACLTEALELRESGIKMPVMILGATPPDCADILSEHRIIQSVHSTEYAKALNAALESSGKTLAVHIKLDTGMSRLGIYAHHGFANDAANEAEAVTKLSNLRAEGIFTHFAESESPDSAFTEEQLLAFSEVCGILEKRGLSFKFYHCANSAAVVNYKKAHLNCVRPGLILYGCSPDGNPIDSLDLRPVMTFKSRIADVRSIRRGDSLSYNRNFTAPHDMKVAVVLCGYADGIHRSLSNKGFFLINGKRAPILGNICMDLTLADVTDIPDVHPFDEAVIFGEQNGAFLSADELAKLSGTISYELLTSVSRRVVRTYSDPSA